MRSQKFTRLQHLLFDLGYSSTLRLAAVTFALLFAMLIDSCEKPGECFEPSFSRTHIDESSSVRIEINSTEIIISNTSQYPIYHEVFPSDFLELIEWEPCKDLTKCREIRIDPEEKKRHNLKQLVFDGSMTFRVFWWHLSEPDLGLIVETFEMNSLKAEFPPRIRCSQAAG